MALKTRIVDSVPFVSGPETADIFVKVVLYDDADPDGNIIALDPIQLDLDGFMAEYPTADARLKALELEAAKRVDVYRAPLEKASQLVREIVGLEFTVPTKGEIEVLKDEMAAVKEQAIREHATPVKKG